MATNELVSKEESRVINEKWDNDDLATVRIKIFRGHTESVGSCQLIQNSEKVFSASDDCSVRLWDTSTGECLRCYKNLHTGNISQAHATLQGSRFVTCSWDKKMKYWDTESGKCILESSHDDFLTCCSISHKEKLIAVGSDLGRALRVYDVDSGLLVHDIKGHHGGTLTSAIFASTDDKVITTSMDKTAKVFDLITANTTIKLEGHSNVVSDCSITENGQKFATASWDKTVQLWDVATGMYRSKGPAVLKGIHDGSVSCCEFSKDGLLLVSGSYDTSIVVWDVENRVQKLKLQGHTDWLKYVCFSEDQNWILSCSKDMTLRLWNISEADQIPIVLQNKKTVGVKVIKCSRCGKPFSMSQLESFRDITVCVFCRLTNPSKSWLTISDP
ncbi:unnamed protein product [Candidula unifasciata]|uniref:WD repeat-containing protein 88 n=1 Tax=Candidula unifasciata TaxID=100452 RepID=A0A8S3YFV7_9EUPU|nr:unnamed protein product [Candidula unifasciata]